MLPDWTAQRGGVVVSGGGDVVGGAVVGAGVVPVWVPPPACSCWPTTWVSCGDVVTAVQPWEVPLAPDTDRTLIETPQTLAAMVIGICALTGIFALSTFSLTARSLSTFDKLTSTSDVAALDTAPAALWPALETPLAASDVLQAETATEAAAAEHMRSFRI